MASGLPRRARHDQRTAAERREEQTQQRRVAGEADLDEPGQANDHGPVNARLNAVESTTSVRITGSRMTALAPSIISAMATGMRIYASRAGRRQACRGGRRITGRNVGQRDQAPRSKPKTPTRKLNRGPGGGDYPAQLPRTDSAFSDSVPTTDR